MRAVHYALFVGGPRDGERRLVNGSPYPRFKVPVRIGLTEVGIFEYQFVPVAGLEGDLGIYADPALSLPELFKKLWSGYRPDPIKTDGNHDH